MSEATTEVMLEVAYLHPESIARTGQDARSLATLEHGSNAELIRDSSTDGLAILTGFIVDICGGEPSTR